MDERRSHSTHNLVFIGVVFVIVLMRAVLALISGSDMVAPPPRFDHHISIDRSILAEHLPGTNAAGQPVRYVRYSYVHRAVVESIRRSRVEEILRHHIADED